MAERGLRKGLALALWVSAWLASSAMAADLVTVAAVSGRADVLADRAAQWTALAPGVSLKPLDQLGTGSSGWIRLLFLDGTVAVVGSETLVRIDEASFGTGRTRILLRLLGGGLRIVASGNFPAQGRLEVETPTAVATIRSTEMIVIYDTENAETDVIAVDGKVEVLGVLGVLGRPVTVDAHSHSVVRKGAFPGPPTPVQEARLAQVAARLRGTVSPSDTLLVGSAGQLKVPEAEVTAPRPPAVVAAAAEGAAAGRRTRRRGLSRDAETIDHSIQEFALTPPGQAPPGNVVVIIE